MEFDRANLNRRRATISRNNRTVDSVIRMAQNGALPPGVKLEGEGLRAMLLAWVNLADELEREALAEQQKMIAEKERKEAEAAREHSRHTSHRRSRAGGHAPGALAAFTNPFTGLLGLGGHNSPCGRGGSPGGQRSSGMSSPCGRSGSPGGQRSSGMSSPCGRGGSPGGQRSSGISSDASMDGQSWVDGGSSNVSERDRVNLGGTPSHACPAPARSSSPTSARSSMPPSVEVMPMVTAISPEMISPEMRSLEMRSPAMSRSTAVRFASSEDKDPVKGHLLPAGGERRSSGLSRGERMSRTVEARPSQMELLALASDGEVEEIPFAARILRQARQLTELLHVTVSIPPEIASGLVGSLPDAGTGEVPVKMLGSLEC